MTAPRDALLRVIVEVEVRSRTEFDLVAFFNGLSERERGEYAALRPGEFVDDGEHHWPIEYITGGREADYGEYDVGSHHHGLGVHADSFPTADVDLSIRRASNIGDRRDWSYEDFMLLRSQVPWMEAFHRGRESGSARCAVCDEPIYDREGRWEHVEGGWVSLHVVEPREPTIEDIIAAKAGRVA